MPEREIPKLLKFLLEFGPIILFFVGYSQLKDETFVVGGVEYSGFIAVTAFFIPLCLITMAIYWRLTGRLARMQAVTTVLVVVFGGLTIWFNDERFFKMKPTMVYLLFAGFLGAGLLRNRSVLQYALEDAMPLSRTGWMRMTRHTLIFCLFLAAANELIWRNMSTDAWVSFKTFGLPILTVLFFVADTFALSRHAVNQPSETQEQAES